MEIDQLRHFLKVAEMANFTKAAQVVGLSQPALSRSIARLEEELGQPILDRQTRQVVLTEAGELLAERAKQIIALADDTRAQITDDGQTGRIRLASIPTIAPYFLPGLLREFSNAHSKATVLVREDTTANLLHMLAEGEIDIAILARPIDMKYLQVTDLFEEELLLVLPAGHSLAQKKTVRVEDIDKEPFVLLGEAHCLTDNIVSFCRQKSFFPVTIERTSQIVTIQELVALGHGISMVPAMARALDNCPRRIYKSLAGPKPTRKIVVVTNPYRFQSKLSQALCKTLLAHSCTLHPAG
jgi:LysR family hydrogen peroxide-inducible transcriptional activator